MDGVIAELLGQGWDQLSDDELLESVRRVEAWSRQLYAVTLAMTKEVDSRGLAGKQGGFVDCGVVVAVAAAVAAAARRRVEDATDTCCSTTISGSRVASRLPGAVAALRAGTLSEEQLGVVRRTLRELPDDVAPSTRIQGAGRLSAEGAAVLRSALSPLAKPLPKDPRSAAKRRADALVGLARRVLNAGTLPVEGGVRLQVGLTVDVVDCRVVDLDWGGTVSIQAARRICCDADIIPIVMRGGSQPLDVGSRQRLVTVPLRRALIARDRGCVAPGCDRPPEWCEAHHLVHWANGDATSINNTALVCGYHHTLLHQGEWTARMIDGVPHLVPPPWIDPHQHPQRNTLHHSTLREAA